MLIPEVFNSQEESGILDILNDIIAGRAFDFDSSGTPDLDRYVETSRKGGLGLYLIRKIMDEVNYRSSKGENRLRLVKTIPRGRVPQRVFNMDGISIRKKFAFWMTTILAGLVLLIYFYFDNRTSNTLMANFQSEMTEISTTVAARPLSIISNTTLPDVITDLIRIVP